MQSIEQLRLQARYLPSSLDLVATLRELVLTQTSATGESVIERLLPSVLRLEERIQEEAVIVRDALSDRLEMTL